MFICYFNSQSPASKGRVSGPSHCNDLVLCEKILLMRTLTPACLLLLGPYPCVNLKKLPTLEQLTGCPLSCQSLVPYKHTIATRLNTLQMSKSLPACLTDIGLYEITCPHACGLTMPSPPRLPCAPSRRVLGTVFKPSCLFTREKKGYIYIYIYIIVCMYIYIYIYATSGDTVVA